MNFNVIAVDLSSLMDKIAPESEPESEPEIECEIYSVESFKELGLLLQNYDISCVIFHYHYWSHFYYISLLLSTLLGELIWILLKQF